MFLAAGKYTDRLFVMILPLCPPVLQCCSEGDSVGLPAGRDPLYWMSKRKEKQEVVGRKERGKNEERERVNDRVTAGATSPSCTINRSINGYR